MELKEEVIKWITKNFRTFFLLILCAANIHQYRAAEIERERYRLFYETVYKNEVERTKKWEDILLSWRGCSR